MDPDTRNPPSLVTRYRGYLAQLGPGFLQSACTIGGGTLGACLFLGSFAGVSALWVQPVAMLLGLVVLFMISAVALSTTENPFRLINRHVSPVLGWGWLVATVAANMVWGLPQYNLGTDALTRMVAPGLLGDGTTGRVIATAIMAGCAVAITLTQLRGKRGGRLFDRLIQLVVAGIVLCFGLVFCRLLIDGSLSIGTALRGLVPSPRLLFEPVAGYASMLAQSVDPEFWSQRITATQRQTALAAIGAAVGINMTFLMPYALRARGWGRDQRELARFDLVTGLFLPFVLVSGFIVSAAGATLYGEKHVDPALVAWRFIQPTDPPPPGLNSYRGNLEAYAQADVPTWASANNAERAALLDAIPRSERTLAAATVKHNTSAFAATLEPLFPGDVGTVIFGIGVFFIALSTVLVHMLINGYALQAGFGIPRAVGSLLPLVAVVGPFFWGELSAYLVIPTSVIGLMLLPVALWGFLLLGRQKLMGADRFGPRMLIVGGGVTVIYTLLSAWAAYGKVGAWGVWLIAGVGIAALITSPAVIKRRQST
ncbi:MAG: hypothetical protein AAFY08_01685 [Planctomycetota bacterium]